MKPPVVIVLILASLAASSSADEAWANGGALRLGRAPAGPFLVSVWTGPARVGALDVSVAVMRPDDGTAVLDAEIVLAAQRRSAPAITVPARVGAGGNRLFYYADLPLTEAGSWNVTVAARGRQGEGVTSFTLEVKPRVPWMWFLLGAAGVSIIAVLGWCRFRNRGTP